MEIQKIREAGSQIVTLGVYAMVIVYSIVDIRIPFMLIGAGGILYMAGRLAPAKQPEKVSA